jgi:hypothetical protein
MSDDRKMKLGPATEWAPWQPKRQPREHAPYDYECGGLYVRKPYERLFERINNRLRYKTGPKRWQPGRYTTSAWQPYTGFGRFSDLSCIMQGKYYASRYTGRHVTPEHYILKHHGVEAYERELASDRRKRSWVCEAA